MHEMQPLRNATAPRRARHTAHAPPPSIFSLQEHAHLSVREWSTLDQRKQSISILEFNSQVKFNQFRLQPQAGNLDAREAHFFGGNSNWGTIDHFDMGARTATYYNRIKYKDI